MNKKINFAKPKKPVATKPAAADEWVEKREVGKGSAPVEPTKRLTIDVPVSLHSRVKAGCAMQGKKMNEVVRMFLENEFPEPAANKSKGNT